MDQSILNADDERDSRIPVNFTGAQLYHCGMNVAEGNFVLVKYGAAKMATAAANVCGNKCRAEGTKNIFTVRRSTDKYGVPWLTIAKVPDYVRLQQKCIDVQSISHTSESVLAQQAAKNAAECENNPAYAEYVSNFSLEKAMWTDALTCCAQGRTDEYMLENGITEEIITQARKQTLTVPKSKVEFIPGADTDWDKTDWSEEQVRNNTLLFDHIKHARKVQLKDPITIAEEQRISKEVAAAICTEVDETAVTERKEARKKELASKKALNPEKYENAEMKEKVVAETKAPVLLTKDGKKSKLQIEMELADASATDTRTLKDCLFDGTVEKFKGLRVEGKSEHEAALLLGITEEVANQLGAYVDTVN